MPGVGGISIGVPSGGGGAGTPAPLTVSGLVLWQRADLAVVLSGSDVTDWNDSSGTGVAARNFTAASGKRPTLSATGGANGTACVTSAAATKVMVSGTNPFTGVTGCHSFIVWKQAADPPVGVQTALRFGSAATTSHYPYSDGTLYSDYGSTTRQTCGNPTPSMADWHVFETISTSSKWQTLINGSSVYNTATNTVGWNSACRLFGSDATPTYGSICSICEHIIFSAELSAGNRTTIINYLNTRYGLAST